MYFKPFGRIALCGLVTTMSVACSGGGNAGTPSLQATGIAKPDAGTNPCDDPLRAGRQYSHKQFFDFTGKRQIWSPATGKDFKALIIAEGAAGGGGLESRVTGLGGCVAATLEIKAGPSYDVFVGGDPDRENNDAGCLGGFNGGGSAGACNQLWCPGTSGLFRNCGFGGGGASSVSRQAGGGRMIVAGGGGGSVYSGGDGGDGGGVNGEDGTDGGCFIRSSGCGGGGQGGRESSGGRGGSGGTGLPSGGSGAHCDAGTDGRNGTGGIDAGAGGDGGTETCHDRGSTLIFGAAGGGGGYYGGGGGGGGVVAPSNGGGGGGGGSSAVLPGVGHDGEIYYKRGTNDGNGHVYIFWN